MRKIAILGACILAAFAANAQQDEVKELFLSGKANYAEYDDLLGKKAFGKLPEGGEVQMANLLLQGYETFNKVLPLDSLPNAKGKVKPKYSKEIHNTLAAAHPHIPAAGGRGEAVGQGQQSGHGGQGKHQDQDLLFHRSVNLLVVGGTGTDPSPDRGTAPLF